MNLQSCRLSGDLRPAERGVGTTTRAPAVLLLLTWLMTIAATPASAQSRTVVVELFTSQGCAACPPADRILESLAQRDDVIALALHVDYWDYIGWADSFGNAKFSARQKTYARRNGRASVYTPQMVIGGVDEVKGSSSLQVMGVLQQHLMNSFTEKTVDLQISRSGDGRLSIEAFAPRGLAYAADVFLIRYRDAETVEIYAGENNGRSLTYHNIVTSWEMLRKWDGSSPLRETVRVEGEDPVVVLIQEEGQGPVVAAARHR